MSRRYEKKKSFLVTVKSRDQLISEDKSKEAVKRPRRTKIVASINDNTLDYEKIK